MNPTLICYDIEDDKLRKKISDRLIQAGLERVQYSVFLGPLKPGHAPGLIEWLSAILPDGTDSDDNILVLPLSPNSLDQLTVLGKNDIDPEALAGRLPALFF